MSGERPPAETAALLAESFPARPDQLKRIRRGVEAALARGDCGEACTRDVVIAVDEACQNIIRHGYGARGEGEIEIRIRRRGPVLELSLRDRAPPVDPARVRPRDLAEVRPGGLGTHFIRSVMDEVEWLRPPDGEGNLLRMRKRIVE